MAEIKFKPKKGSNLKPKTLLMVYLKAWDANSSYTKNYYIKEGKFYISVQGVKVTDEEIYAKVQFIVVNREDEVFCSEVMDYNESLLTHVVKHFNSWYSKILNEDFTSCKISHKDDTVLNLSQELTLTSTRTEDTRFFVYQDVLEFLQANNTKEMKEKIGEIMEIPSKKVYSYLEENCNQFIKLYIIQKLNQLE